MDTLRKPTRGFTLTELMVTLAVLAILVTIAVPSFSGMIATQATRNASFDLSSAVSLARAEAVKQNAIATVSTTSNWAAGWTLKVGTSATLIRTFGPYSGVTIATNTGTTLSFGNDGRPTAGGVTFQITPTGSSQSVSPSCVQVGGTGRVAVVSGACT
jgi:type IV fimbrial biogenesis protein FimT